jgi:ubiquinone/menaquinone biosynthesis C-methylase UbiE
LIIQLIKPHEQALDKEEVKMHTNTHGANSATQTEGRLIRWTSFYDISVNVMTLGQADRLRLLTLDQALLKHGESILDVGCGTGGVTIPAKIRVGENGSAAGIDPAPEMIAVAHRKAKRAGIEIDFRVGVIESLPFPDETFDVVTSSLMMHHLPEHLQVKGLAEIMRVLKPGGRLLIADMMRPGLSPFKRFFTSLAFHHGHGVQFGIEDLPELLKEAGFEEIKQLDDHFLTIGFVRATKPAK